MEKQIIISISREFGSGGHVIAQKIAEHYKLRLLDQNILEEVAQERSLDAAMLKELDEKHKKPVISRTVRGFSSSPEENVYLLQFEYLRKLAAKGESFVVVGRCSDSVLKDFEGLITVFVLGEEKKEVQRIMELYKKTETQAKKLIREKNAKRKQYHNSFCNEKWGESANYDISINSGKLGIDETALLLIDYIDRRMQ